MSRNADRSPPAFADLERPEDLLAWSRSYAARAVDVHDLAVDRSLLEWEVSTRAKRRAAAVRHPNLPDAAVGRPIDWPAAVDAHGGAYAERTGREPEGLRRCTVVLTKAAAEAFDRGEWQRTIRHELVHVEQFQAFGATDHGPAFEGRARELAAPVTCPRFAEPSYRLNCRACGDVVGHRYRASAVTREPDRYRSSCCAAPLKSREL